MFTQHTIITSDKLLKLLIENGYVDKGFSNGNIIQISHETIKGQEVFLRNAITFKVETKRLNY